MCVIMLVGLLALWHRFTLHRSDRDMALAMQMQQEEDARNAKQAEVENIPDEHDAHAEKKKKQGKHKGDCVVQ